MCADVLNRPKYQARSDDSIGVSSLNLVLLYKQGDIIATLCINAIGELMVRFCRGDIHNYINRYTNG